ncbi:MAG: phosphodiester glycosidase family protein, partial [bacterium]|nr:phosphodiester glycosidase family protein [bacterium]
SYTELGNFCKDTLGAEFAVAEDGGGSSTLWVDGQVKNSPSDGSERYVANGLMMVNVIPMSKTSTFFAGNKVMAKTDAEVRLGPGTNYAVTAIVPTGMVGKIVAHSVNGVYAKGKYWWKWKYANVEGWTAEENLEYVPAGRIKDWDKY